MADNKLKLQDKSVLISGADSGIGRAVALLFAKEGADIAIIYHSNDKDAEDTKDEIEKLGRKAIVFSGDVNNFQFCKVAVNKVVSKFGKLDILINNAGVQFSCDDIIELEEEHIRETFNANIIGLILLS
ncbi:SDR family NAD(P)-dependent oxidoreductase, partial [Chryseobacterium sp.]|uniref:SDR family NAD(P)-dependent oxidoreductase n=1 Tax=Chryseobacterium sp. TaxID=1871047 RepID=UPI00289B9BE7